MDDQESVGAGSDRRRFLQNILSGAAAGVALQAGIGLGLAEA